MVLFLTIIFYEMKLDKLKTMQKLNQEELNFISGGFYALASGSDNTDVDTTSNDSYTDDNSKSTDSYKNDSIITIKA